MEDKLFISKAEILKIKDVSENIEDSAFEQAIRESQIVELVPAIGDELFLVLQNDFDEDKKTFGTAKYTDLFDGKDYTYQGKSIRYRGIKPMLTYYAYARLLNNAQLSLTRSGAKMFMVEEDVAENTVQAQIKTKIIEARAMAQRFEEDVFKFLDNNRTDYPEMDLNRDTNQPFEFIKI